MVKDFSMRMKIMLRIKGNMMQGDLTSQASNVFKTHTHSYIYICKSFLCNCTEKLGFEYSLYCQFYHHSNCKRRFDTNAFYINVSEFSSIISIACTIIAAQMWNFGHFV